MKETPSQTAGPYVHIGCVPNFAGMAMFGGDLGAKMLEAPRADQMVITGVVHDGDGAPLADGMVEIWQADANGLHAGEDGFDAGFAGWGRAAGDMTTGAFRFETIKPGPVDGQAPHITVWIVARGINLGLHTRMYFPEDDLTGDPLMALVPESRRATLVAAKTDAGYHFDIHLQGPQETVFLDI